MGYITTYRVPWHERWLTEAQPVRIRDGRLRALVAIATHDGDAIVRGAGGAKSGYVDLLGAAVLARRGHHVLVADATWQVGSRALDRALRRSRPIPGVDSAPVLGEGLARGAVGAFDHPRIHYAVLSGAEETLFPDIWNVNPERVHFVPFCATIRGDQSPGAHLPFVFAGGNSLRDYRALVDARTQIKWPVTVATSLFGSANPPGVSFLEPKEYRRRSIDAAITVVPLMRGTTRSAGQQTYLNAMLLGQAVVVTDAPGVRDYVEHGRTGLIVSNERDALATAVNELIDDPGRRRKLGEAGRAEVLERFKRRHYYDRLLDLADGLVST